MATREKGITIDIGGDTTKLQKAIGQLNAPINKLNTELKDVTKALNFDPKNTDLLAQKQDVLRRNIQATKDKLQELTKAQQQMGEYSSLTDEQKQAYNRLSAEIAKSKEALQNMNSEMKKTTNIDLSSVTNGLKKVGEVALDVSKKLLEVTTAVSGALAGLVGAGVNSYADLEQNIGGINKIFGDSAEQLIANSKEAYKTAGLSANQYMETATTFSASLLKGLGGDTQQAVQLTDRAIKDMSDNANTFGTSMDEVANVYKALSKEQYTTLDNLRLGYAGTKEGMKQLIADASSYKDIQEELGISVDASSMSFDNMINAISVVQSHLGIMGTTSSEASETISGSINTMKASFDNFLNGSGSPQDLAKSVNTALKNISNTVKKLAPSILDGVGQLFKDIVPEAVNLIIGLLPQLLEAVTGLINTLFTMISQNKEQIKNTITSLLNTAITFLTENIPTILEIGVTILVTLAQGIISALPTLSAELPKLITTIINIIIENIPLILQTGIQLLLAIVEAIPVIIDELQKQLPSIIDTLVNTLIDNLPTLIEASIQLLSALIIAIPEISFELAKSIPTLVVTIVKTLWDKRGEILESGKKILLNIKDGIVNHLSTLWDKIKEIPGNIKEKLIEGISKIKEAGKELINGMWEGIKEKWESLKNKVAEFGEGIVKKFKSVFGIASPSKVFKKEIGQYLAMGVSSGFEETMEDVTDDMTKSIPIDELVGNVNNAMRGLSYGIEHSINPTINPNISLDQNYLLMAQAMKNAMQDMNIELDDREVGKFISKTITNEVF